MGNIRPRKVTSSTREALNNNIQISVCTCLNQFATVTPTILAVPKMYCAVTFQELQPLQLHVGQRTYSVFGKYLIPLCTHHLRQSPCRKNFDLSCDDANVVAISLLSCGGNFTIKLTVFIFNLFFNSSLSICVTVSTLLLVFGNWVISVSMNYSGNKYYTTCVRIIFHRFSSFQVCHQ